MLKRVTTIVCAGLFVVASTGCDIDQTEEGRLPNIDVDVDGDPGKLPAFDVDGPDVDVSMEEKKIKVPDVDVDVSSEEATIKVPDVDVSLPEDNE